MPDNDFGYTAWGKNWVRLAEPLSMSKPEPMLPRARSIARTGGVQLEIEGVTVRAAIHRGASASVTYLEFAPLSRAAIDTIGALVPGDAIGLGDELHAAIVDAGVSLAPRLVSADCSCPARNQRCLHMLVTCYALARKVDETPWLALDLQGYRSIDRAASAGEAEAGSPETRWTPLDTLDPASFFGLAR
ncbi:hypothetical protein [Nocardia sp. NPDC020380]|uniref:hypothetical protein n=1 Tax=Nocardia sp. NPDC020380 TaxID=3364309 RepID=UPI0037B900CC